MENKKLYRSLNDRKLAGVCGGLAEHFMIDPVIVRIIFICMLFGGVGFFIYVVLWIVLPDKPYNVFEEPIQTAQEEKKDENNTTNNETYNANTMETPFEQNKPVEKKRSSANLTGGIILITLGVLFLCERFIPNICFDDLWPILLIVIGITIVFRGYSRNKK